MNELSTERRHRIWMFVLVANAVILTATVGVAALAFDKDLGTWPLWPVAIATFVATAWPIHITTSSGRHSISLIEAVLVVGMFTHDPLTFLLGTVIGAIPAFLRLRQPLIKFAVNVTQTVLWTVLPLLFFHALTGARIEPRGSTFAAALTAALIAVVGSASTIKIPIGFASGTWRPEHGELRRVASGVATSLGAASIGLIGVVLGGQDPRLLLLLALPALQIALSTIQQARDAETSRLFDFTVAAGDRLRDEPDTPMVLVDLLEEIRAAFGVRDASLLVSAPGETVRVEADETGSGRVSGITAEEHLRAWLAERSLDGPALLANDPSLADLGAALGTSDLIVAPLPSRHGDGAIVLRDGLGTALRRDHREFLRTLSSSASAALERHALSQELDAAARREIELERRASHDGLTGLANRSLFEREVAAALASEVEVTVLYIDLNDFKQINDVYGHASGDAVLVATARRMQRVLRPRDIAARLGGDEFAVLIRREGLALGQTIGNRILLEFDAPVEAAPAVREIKAAIGSASSRPGDSVESLLHRADEAMYVAKRGRSDRVITA